MPASIVPTPSSHETGGWPRMRSSLSEGAEIESRRAEQQKRRDHKREQEMLDDMRAEEVSIAERIDGRNQIEKQQQNAGQKIRRAIQAVFPQQREVADRECSAAGDD